MNSITPELIDYLRKLPTRPTASRRQMLEETRRRVTCGERDAQALVPFALPSAVSQRPDPALIRWHNERKYLG